MVQHQAFRAAQLLPLRPCFSCHSTIPSQSISSSLPTRAFSSSPISFRRTKDNNKNRGVSFLRATGFRRRQPQLRRDPARPLPVPVLDRKKKQVEIDDDHGLWAFFPKSKLSMSFSNEEISFGRHWTHDELRDKSWEDLHKLWWVCFKEKSRIATSLHERERLKTAHGDEDLHHKIRVISATQRSIKYVLVTRWYAWEDARKIAATDPSVDLTGNSLSGAYNVELDRENGLYDEPAVADNRPYSGTITDSATPRP